MGKPTTEPRTNVSEPEKSESPTPPTNVASHSYDHATKSLDVDFHSGSSYRYHDVTPKQAREFSQAPSRGSYLHSNIIGKCDAEKLERNK